MLLLKCRAANYSVNRMPTRYAGSRRLPQALEPYEATTHSNGNRIVLGSDRGRSRVHRTCRWPDSESFGHASFVKSCIFSLRCCTGRWCSSRHLRARAAKALATPQLRHSVACSVAVSVCPGFRWPASSVGIGRSITPCALTSRSWRTATPSLNLSVDRPLVPKADARVGRLVGVIGGGSRGIGLQTSVLLKSGGTSYDSKNSRFRGFHDGESIPEPVTSYEEGLALEVCADSSLSPPCFLSAASSAFS